MAVMTEVSRATSAAHLHPSSSSPAPSAAAAARANGDEKLRFIEEMTSNVDAVQQRVLAEILARNAATEYLANCGLDAATADRDAFRAKVPVVSYDALKPYIQRIVDGDRSPILSSHPVSEFLTSSGTSAGERKLMPTVEDELERRQSLYSLLMPVMNLYVSGLEAKGLYFLFVKSETRTPGGLPARPVLTSYYKSDLFRNRTHDPYHNYTSPTAAILCADAFQSMYAQMLCGLCQRHEVLRVGAVFASGLLRAIRFLQLNWEQLADDIEAGTLTPRVTDPSVREAVADILRRPDPELARFVRNECRSGDWAGIITRVWPNTKYLDVIVTGAMAQYIPTLKHYSGGLPMACTMYASSECYFGLNLRPLCDPAEVAYTIMPNMGYFEFLPVDSAATGASVAEASASDLVELARVEAGREYELVITTYAGLNRYRVGDVLRVTGFHNAAPQFQFVRRKNVLLSIESDKTDEAELQRAVERAAELLRPHGASVVEYTSQACTRSIPGHYVIYWELLATGSSGGAKLEVEKETLDSCCLEMEEALNTVYRQSRVADGSIGPLEIRVVRPGTFEELMDYAISRGASINQYKAPRCVTFPPIIELLDSRVVSSHFSPALPHWTPTRRSD
ncbi:hypothetical protein QYE76_018046 [Lolium multiflorum]|uniref:Uncharacterized protein n=1 Tax=Lolium multiflorum TaxID=4521 RepID=A0AAD8QKN9_LOLMU|nr:hypothetical protein QYE76_018046 [Lolium multiflorum]